MQKWKEITQSGNKDYKDQLEKHWNVSVGDGFSELCAYLGGVSSSLDINEVVILILQVKTVLILQVKVQAFRMV